LGRTAPVAAPAGAWRRRAHRWRDVDRADRRRHGEQPVQLAFTAND